jgi:hypothetical protein
LMVRVVPKVFLIIQAKSGIILWFQKGSQVRSKGIW